MYNFQIEEESHDPYIVIVHDFITEKQADALVELGKPKVRPLTNI